MKPLTHTTAHASYYDSRAGTYDAFNEERTQTINALLEKILNERNISTVLDMTCGTGSQVFWLAKAGFTVVGSDISPGMLEVAKAKAGNTPVSFVQGDCRTIRVGEFDAVITIANAIGHLTREDFRQTINNIAHNLKPQGFYIFDIFNLAYLKHENNIAKLTIDWLATHNGQLVREVQFSTITDDGILASYSTYIHQEGHAQPTQITEGYGNTLQVYTSDELKSLLAECGFVVVQQTGVEGEAFSPLQTERILTIAQKQVDSNYQSEDRIPQIVDTFEFLTTS